MPKIQAAFDLTANMPLDGRTVVASIAERNAIAYPYVGLEVYVTGESKKYRCTALNSGTAVWEEVAEGGGNASVEIARDNYGIHKNENDELYIQTGAGLDGGDYSDEIKVAIASGGGLTFHSQGDSEDGRLEVDKHALSGRVEENEEGFPTGDAVHSAIEEATSGLLRPSDVSSTVESNDDNPVSGNAVYNAIDDLRTEMAGLKKFTPKGSVTLAEGQTIAQWLADSTNTGTPEEGDVWVFPNATDDGKTEEWYYVKKTVNNVVTGSWQLLGIRGGQTMSVRVIDEDEDPDDYELVIG